MKNWIEGSNQMNKKLCILTGVGPETGTGAEIARYFSENGYHVAMIARTEDNLKNLEKKYNNTTAYPCDVGNIEDFKKIIDKIQKVDNKVNNLMIIGHNPGLTYLVNYFSNINLYNLPTTGIVIFDILIEGWKDISFIENQAPYWIKFPKDYKS